MAAQKLSIPIMAYNNPSTGGSDMSPELIARLLEISNVTMVKESTGDIERVKTLQRLTGGEVAIYNGSNPLAFEMFDIGAKGWCTAAANLIPEQNVALFNAFDGGTNRSSAIEIFESQAPLLRFLVKYGLPRTVAAGLQLNGISVGPLRKPLLPLTDSQTKELETLLDLAKSKRQIV